MHQITNIKAELSNIVVELGKTQDVILQHRDAINVISKEIDDIKRDFSSLKATLVAEKLLKTTRDNAYLIMDILQYAIDGNIFNFSFSSLYAPFLQ